MKMKCLYAAMIVLAAVGCSKDPVNNEDEKKDDTSALDTPTNLTLSVTSVTAGSTETATLSWDAVSDAASYQIFSNSAAITTTTSASYTLNASDLSEGSYALSVQALAASTSTRADSEISTAVTLTVTAADIPDDTSALDVPTNLALSVTSVTAGSTETAVLSWNAVSDAESYRIYSNSAAYATTTATSYTFKASDLSEGEYAVSVQALAASTSTRADSEMSSTVTLTVTAADDNGGNGGDDNNGNGGDDNNGNGGDDNGGNGGDDNNGNGGDDNNGNGGDDNNGNGGDDDETGWKAVSTTSVTTWGEDIWKGLNEEHGTSEWKPAGTPELYSDNRLGFYNGDGSGYKFDKTSSVYRVQLAGGGSTTKCNLQFKVKGNGAVSVTAGSSKSGNSRTLRIYDGDTEITNDADVVSETAGTTFTHTLTDITGETVISICSKSSGINIFEVTWTPAN